MISSDLANELQSMSNNPPSASESLPHVSIVIIGYNEESNLPAAFRAVLELDYPPEKIEIIYVDSGSKDGSVKEAAKYTNRIFVESIRPSAGRNRNRGLIEAKYDIVHFIDGDVQISPNYLKCAVEILQSKPVHAVVGRLDERNKNILNSIAALSNAKRSEGPTLFTSTGATFFRSALLSVDGYDERIKRGQEIDLGSRFREAGFTIWATMQTMGIHNFGYSSIIKYIRTYYTQAISLVRCSWLPGDSPFLNASKRSHRNQLGKLLLLVSAAIYSLYARQIGVFFLIYLVLVILQNRSYFKNHNRLLILLRILLSLAGLIFWIYGIIAENIRFVTNRRYRDYYAVPKDVL